MAGLLLLWYDFGDRDKDLDGQESDTVLVVLNEMLEEGDHLFDNDRRRHLLDEFCKICGRLTAHHRCLIVNQYTKLLAELLLYGGRNLLVWCCEKTTAGYL